MTKLTKTPYSFFCLQYNGIRLIKVIRLKKKKKESKESHTFFLIALVLMKQAIFQSCLASFQCQDEKRKYYKDDNQALTL